MRLLQIYSYDSKRGLVTVNQISIFFWASKKARLRHSQNIQLPLTRICFMQCQTCQFRDGNSANFLAAVTMFSIIRNSYFSATKVIEFCLMHARMIHSHRFLVYRCNRVLPRIILRYSHQYVLMKCPKTCYVAV